MSLSAVHGALASLATYIEISMALVLLCTETSAENTANNTNRLRYFIRNLRNALQETLPTRKQMRKKYLKEEGGEYNGWVSHLSTVASYSSLRGGYRCSTSQGGRAQDGSVYSVLTVAPHPTDKVPRRPQRGREGVRPLSALEVEEAKGQAIGHILALL